MGTPRPAPALCERYLGDEERDTVTTTQVEVNAQRAVSSGRADDRPPPGSPATADWS